MIRPAIIVASGRLVEPFDLKPEDVELAVLAHTGSQINRFGGHTKTPYSVNAHQVFCYRVAKAIGCTPTMQGFALLHDACEAYSGFGDVAAPLKRHMRVKPPKVPGTNHEYDTLSVLEYRLSTAIFEAAGLHELGEAWTAHHTELMNVIDSHALAVEAEALLPGGTSKWGWQPRRLNHVDIPLADNATASIDFFAACAELGLFKGVGRG